jgi:hypothetical protein
MNQASLLHAQHFTQRLAYQALFQHLPVLAEPRGLSRPRVSPMPCFVPLFIAPRGGLTPSLILVQALHEIPALAEAVGFDPLRPLPLLERFSALLSATNNALLQAVRLELLKNLLAEKITTGSNVALDSCPIASPVRESNLKTAVRDRVNKERFRKADMTARLGVSTSYVSPPRERPSFSGATATMSWSIPKPNCPSGNELSRPIGKTVRWHPAYSKPCWLSSRYRSRWYARIPLTTARPSSDLLSTVCMLSPSLPLIPARVQS